ncbi:AAEL008620-PA [Aedes aegypti]|uniref:AAEL008620-PA n=2 Tax=Aedes aegypti TaxID=7159 RepID=A0A1S4FK98_AEDAE|nr:37 kDa salivary gland allergen Aed a 2-like [Aedes aegypti]EAT39591.1 AAEL008620-PA [Aedes aegypti]
MALALSPFWTLLLLVGSLVLSVSGSAIPCEGQNAEPASAASGEWQPRTPEQTLYAYVRCLNDSSASIEQKINWVKWHPDTTYESQCYVKCVSEELRLYDPKEKRFRPERFVLQAESFFHADPEQLQALKNNAEPMLAGVLADNSCESVFNKYATFYATHHSTILRMFHGDYRDIGNTYAKLGNGVKQIGQMFVDFCEKRTDFKWNEDNSCPPEAFLDCVFRGFRWITEEGEVNVNEIRRDYEAAGKGAADMADYCGSVKAGARQLYNCLRDKGADSLVAVIRDRNQKTAFYFDLSSKEEPWKSAVDFANNL